MSTNLDPDQALCFVGPDLGLNCLQRTLVGKELKVYNIPQQDSYRQFCVKFKHFSGIFERLSYSFQGQQVNDLHYKIPLGER